MEIKEIIDRGIYGDPRIFQAMQEIKKTDKSFTEKGLFGPPKYKQVDVREIWFQGIALGMKEGINMSSLEGQRIDLYNNCKTSEQKEFLEKFYKLSEEYNCAIAFHPQNGMCVIDIKKIK